MLVLNLDDRIDRWEQIQENFKKWPPLERVSAVKESPGWKGCLKSHVKAIEMAKNRNYPWVIVLEDDCVVGENSLTQLNSLLPSLWKRKADWNVFLGGTTFVDDITIIQKSPPILKVKAYTAHFCLYNSNIYNTIIEKSRTNETPIDIIIREYTTLYCTSPHIALQRPGKSDITDDNADYSNAFTESQMSLQKFISSEQSLEGFLQDTDIFWNKLTIVNILILSVVFILAKKYIG